MPALSSARQRGVELLMLLAAISETNTSSPSTSIHLSDRGATCNRRPVHLFMRTLLSGSGVKKKKQTPWLFLSNIQKKKKASVCPETCLYFFFFCSAQLRAALSPQLNQVIKILTWQTVKHNTTHNQEEATVQSSGRMTNHRYHSWRREASLIGCFISLLSQGK